MKQKIKLGLVASLALVSLQASNMEATFENKVSSLQKQIDELKALQQDASWNLEDRIDAVETRTMIDKINFGIDFRTRVDNFEITDESGVETSVNNIWSNRLRLNMESEITKDMKFTGRLTMYKNWSDTGVNYMFSSMDPMQGRRPANSALYVERAYVDWNIIKGIVPLTLTIGRQPSSDGPSHQFKDNTVRKATYSALSFDGAADGLVATLGLTSLTGIDGMALRFAYGKGFQADTTYTYVGDSGAIKDSNVVGAFFDSGLGIDGSLLQLSYVKASDIVSNTTAVDGSNTNTNLGDISLYTAVVEFTNIFHSGLDIFAHYALSESSPNGVTSFMGYDSDNDGVPDMNYPMGLLTNTPGDTVQKDGHALWIGARYALPIESMNTPKIGFEYNKGSENWFSFTQGSNSLTNKLATRGEVYEAYYIQPINRYAHLRVGAELIDYDYTGSGYQIGAPMSSIAQLNNYYLLFNVAY